MENKIDKNEITVNGLRKSEGTVVYKTIPGMPETCWACERAGGLFCAVCVKLAIEYALTHR